MEDVDRHVGPVGRIAARLHVEMVGIGMVGIEVARAVVVDHVPLHRRQRPAAGGEGLRDRLGGQRAILAQHRVRGRIPDARHVAVHFGPCSGGHGGARGVRKCRERAVEGRSTAALGQSIQIGGRDAPEIVGIEAVPVDQDHMTRPRRPRRPRADGHRRSPDCERCRCRPCPADEGATTDPSRHPELHRFAGPHHRHLMDGCANRRRRVPGRHS